MYTTFNSIIITYNMSTTQIIDFKSLDDVPMIDVILIRVYNYTKTLLFSPISNIGRPKGYLDSPF